MESSANAGAAIAAGATAVAALIAALVTCCGAKAIAVEIRQKKAAIDFMVT